MAVGAWHEHSPAWCGKSAGRHLRSVLVGSFSKIPQKRFVRLRTRSCERGTPVQVACAQGRMVVLGCVSFLVSEVPLYMETHSCSTLAMPCH